MVRKLKTFNQYLDYLAQRLRNEFYLDIYRVRFVRKKKDIENEDERFTWFDIDINNEYLEIDIGVYPVVKRAFKEKDYKIIYELMLHEFCHYLYSPLEDFIEDKLSKVEKEIWDKMIEKQTQHIRNILIGFKNINYKNYGKSKYKSLGK